MESTVHYRIKYRSNSPDGGPPFGPAEIGKGEYARVFEAEEIVHGPDGTQLWTVPVVAKVFHDVGPDDSDNAFETEVALLREFADNDGIVRLRGIARQHPPTFVCQECGEVFEVVMCPECGGDARLANQRDASSEYLALRCTKVSTHVFRQNDDGEAKLWKQRPCGHLEHRTG